MGEKYCMNMQRYSCCERRKSMKQIKSDYNNHLKKFSKSKIKIV